MSGLSSRLENDTRFVDDVIREGEDISVRHPERTDEGDPTPIPSPELNEETVIMKKYGGLLQRKPPLISQDHEHAFFDSADWALAKQGPHKQPRGPLEPKLQPATANANQALRLCSSPQANPLSLKMEVTPAAAAAAMQLRAMISVSQRMVVARS